MSTWRGGGLGVLIDVDEYGNGGVGSKEEARHVSDVDGEGMGGVGGRDSMM